MEFSFRYIWYKLFWESSNPFIMRELWLNQSAKKYVEEYVKGGMRVLEYGGGGSTLYFTDKKCFTETIEKNKEWRNKISASLINKDYHKFVNKPKGKYDLILVDSEGDRIKEFAEAQKHVKEKGIIVFDNIDRYLVQTKPKLLFIDYATNTSGITHTGIYL